MAFFEKMEATLDAVIMLDSHNDTVGLYVFADGNKDSIQHNVVNCKSRTINDEFFSRFSVSLKKLREKCPNAPMQKVALVLPDHLFMMDTIKLPVINRKAMKQSLMLATNTLYKNRDSLEINSDVLQQNRRQVTYAISGVRKDVLKRFKAVCGENNVGIQSVTFAANATVNAATALNSDVKGSTCLVVDIQEKHTRFAFVVRGKTIGYYSLPFGYSILSKNRVAAEDLLFDHTSAELLVLNAKERARSKQLTLAEEIATFENIDDDDMNDMELAQPEGEEDSISIPGGGRRVGRKLPKFMIRPAFQTREECVYENFRLFVKWTLELIASNPEINSYGPVMTAYVNLPREYGFLFDVVNVEAGENKVVFTPLVTGDGNSENILRCLDVYGGFYANPNNKNCIF